MQALAAVMAQQAAEVKDSDGNPDQTLAARSTAAAANLAHLQSSLQNVTTAQTYLINQLSTQGVSALSDFFTAGISGSKSFSEALGDLATSFENIVAKMISQLLIYYALTEILGFAGVSQGTITSLLGTSPFAKGHEAGGYTANIGRDKVAGVVHGGEWVATADQVGRYRPLFDMIMAGTLDSAMADPVIIPRVTQASQASTYARGIAEGRPSIGSGEGYGAGGQPIVQVINKTGQPTSQTQSRGPGGQSITQIIVGAVAADIAKGGDAAKAMERNYGVSRRGVGRG